MPILATITQLIASFAIFIEAPIILAKIIRRYPSALYNLRVNLRVFILVEFRIIAHLTAGLLIWTFTRKNILSVRRPCCQEQRSDTG